MLNKLRELNNKILLKTTNNKVREKHELIKKILADDKCFFKINIETAYAILRELNIPEENLKTYYMNLISSTNYK